jgi:rhodanese-related sulfurtransferase
MSADELKKRVEANEPVILVDTRSRPVGTIAKGAHSVPYNQVPAWAEGVAKDALVVVYCTCHNESTSSRVVMELQKLGFTNAYFLVGGLVAYKASGLPTDHISETAAAKSAQPTSPAKP